MRRSRCSTCGPGRTASWTYRRAVATVKNGVYLAPPDPMSGVAVDFSKAHTVLSIGAPLIEGWGAPGNVLAARPGFRLIHAGALETPTAVMADEWLRINPRLRSLAGKRSGIPSRRIKGSEPRPSGSGPCPPCKPNRPYRQAKSKTLPRL